MANSSGPYILADEPIEINAGRMTVRLWVSNTADRAIQVGSHFHFFECNRALRFDRRAAYGRRLNLPAGTAARFEPGDRREVELVALGGTRQVAGFNGLINGPIIPGEPSDETMAQLTSRGFSHEPSTSARVG